MQPRYSQLRRGGRLAQPAEQREDAHVVCLLAAGGVKRRVRRAGGGCKWQSSCTAPRRRKRLKMTCALLSSAAYTSAYPTTVHRDERCTHSSSSGAAYPSASSGEPKGVARRAQSFGGSERIGLPLKKSALRRRSISESSSARSPSGWRASVLYAASVSPYFGSRRKRRRAKRSSGEFCMGVPVRHLVEM